MHARSHSEPASNLANILVGATVCFCQIATRSFCSSRNLNTGRSTTDGVNSFVRRLGSWSWLAKTNHQSELLGKKLSNFAPSSCCLSRATVRGVPKGSGQGSGGATTIRFFSITQAEHRSYFLLRSTLRSGTPLPRWRSRQPRRAPVQGRPRPHRPSAELGDRAFTYATAGPARKVGSVTPSIASKIQRLPSLC